MNAKNPEVSKQPSELLLEYKFSFLTTLANIGMTWWVSSVAFCSSIIAGVWIYRCEVKLIDAPRIHIMFSIVTLFFFSVIVFGLYMAYVARKLKIETKLLGKFSEKNGSLFEFDIVRIGYYIGTTSFMFVLALWIGLWIIVPGYECNIGATKSP